MSADSAMREVVSQAYAQRRDAWESAAVRIKHWLKQQQKGLLKNKDISRLDVDGHRIKDPARTLAKLVEKAADDPDLRVSTPQDVENHIRDIVGVKVLCKSPRDQKMMFDSLTDPQQLGAFTLIEQKNYVDPPKPNGYRACHVTLQIPSDQGEPVFAEIQVKTRLQDAWGELTHEDMYKPGAAMKPSELHGEFARAMANMLATVDDMADTLAVELSALTNPDLDTTVPSAADDTIEVKVRATGPKYALAVDGDGRQGLIPAFAVRKLSDSKGTIKVNDFISVDDRLRATVEEDSKGLYYIPMALP
ncbi:putative GTP pyrophosphokinase [Brevibacterium aurantiacum]|uniref:Putative GTP pyrophosphokinase n=1 Tax=Brevibacterium aurantiacum TaxID=273384 RepID=A0A2H1KL50_BREAU|nr:RelA/SpoT domain-containing protein [Brevibacterium aurantiacum]SMY00294.1 putative GTP pyrophosphokinase [Brevibacterium aurantiacum]